MTSNSLGLRKKTWFYSYPGSFACINLLKSEFSWVLLLWIVFSECQKDPKTRKNSVTRKTPTQLNFFFPSLNPGYQNKTPKPPCTNGVKHGRGNPTSQAFKGKTSTAVGGLVRWENPTITGGFSNLCFLYFFHVVQRKSKDAHKKWGTPKSHGYRNHHVFECTWLYVVNVSIRIPIFDTSSVQQRRCCNQVHMLNSNIGRETWLQILLSTAYLKIKTFVT